MENPLNIRPSYNFQHPKPNKVRDRRAKNLRCSSCFVKYSSPNHEVGNTHKSCNTSPKGKLR